MGRPRKISILNEFERVKEPDFAKLAELTEKAKGNRPASVFADLCGVHPSTISRILNKEPLRTQMSDTLLIAIAANAESENGEIFKDLLDAHGVAPKNGAVRDYNELLEDKLLQLRYIADSFSDNAGSSTARSEMQIVKDIKEIIHNELYFDEGWSIGSPEETEVECKQRFDRSGIASVSYDFAFYVKKRGLKEIKMYFVLDGTSQKAMSRLEKVFSMAYLNHPIQHDTKFYVVLTESSIFQRMKKVLEDCRVRDSITLMLLDLRYRGIRSTYEIRTL